MIEIDGSYGEGGGQILRTSVSLSAITGRPVTIYNIRGKRPKPGLQPQHLMAVRAAGEICGAKLRGDAAGSVHLTFEPTTPPQPGEYRFDIGTAGATTLVVQTVLLPLALQSAPSRVVVTGGTYNPHAPVVEYMEDVYLRAMARAGLDCTFRVPKAGYFPVGGGEVQVEIRPSQLKPLNLTSRGSLKALHAFVTSSNLPEHVIERGMKVVRAELSGLPVKPRWEDRPSPGTGAAVIVSAEYENGFAGFTGLGKRGKPMEKVASEPCAELKVWLQGTGCVDEHLADQLVLPMALAGAGEWTTDSVSEHLRTVAWLVPQFLPERRIEVDEDGGRVRVVELTN